MQSNKKIADWSLYIMVFFSIAIIALFYLGGVKDPASEITEYNFTDPLLYWAYILIALGTLAIFIFGLYKFILLLKDSPKKALSSMMEISVLAVVFFISWSLGSGEPLNLPGYEGTDNVYLWLKWGDTLLYTTYLIIGAAIAIMAFFYIVKLFNR